MIGILSKHPAHALLNLVNQSLLVNARAGEINVVVVVVLKIGERELAEVTGSVRGVTPP